jgi:hypothetical protein
VGADTQRFGRNSDIDLLAWAAGDVPAHAVIQTRSVAHVKGQAIQCHASQSGGMPRVAIALVVRLLGNKEYFSRAVPVQPPPHMERDLFEGVR